MTIMSDEQKAELVQTVKESCDKGVLMLEDAAHIMGICDAACHRRIAEIDELLRPSDLIQ